MEDTNTQTETPTDAPEITTEPTPSNHPGVEDGHVIETPQDEPNEKVVYDRDADGNVIGWHKEII